MTGLEPACCFAPLMQSCLLCRRKKGDGKTPNPRQKETLTAKLVGRWRLNSLSFRFSVHLLSGSLSPIASFGLGFRFLIWGLGFDMGANRACRNGPGLVSCVPPPSVLQILEYCILQYQLASGTLLYLVYLLVEVGLPRAFISIYLSKRWRTKSRTVGDCDSEWLFRGRF